MTLGVLNHKWTIYITAPSNSLETIAVRGCRKTLRARGQEGLKQSSVFWTRQNFCTQKLTAVVVGCTIPAQDQANQSGVGVHEFLPQPECLWTVDGFWRKESLFSLGVWLLIVYPCSSDGHTLKHIDSAN